ncbi:MAG: hypothetical protein SGJ04_06010 [Bacteroidota bacterium]|nr:hypothetical protein [Bacteroidota bacterium]
MKFVIRVSFIAVCIFFLWNGALYSLIPTGGKGQNQQQQNSIAAQNFVHRPNIDTLILLGSSLSARLGVLPNGSYNLSFSGGSAFTGIEIIKKDKKTPKYLLIELNFINRNPDLQLVSTAFFPKYANEYLPALYQKYQPVNLFTTLLPSQKKANQDNGYNKQLQDQLLAVQLIDYMREPDMIAYKKGIKMLALTMAELEKKWNVQVYYYIIPVHSEIKASTTYKAILPLFYASFKSTGRLLPEADCTNYTYNDGVHLSYESVAPFTEFIMNNFKKLIKVD